MVRRIVMLHRINDFSKILYSSWLIFILLMIWFLSKTVIIPKTNLSL